MNLWVPPRHGGVINTWTLVSGQKTNRLGAPSLGGADRKIYLRKRDSQHDEN